MLAVLVSLAAGCNQSDTTTPAPATNASVSNPREVQPLSPASRDTESRRYGAETNNASRQDANNTGRNVRDRSDTTLTPFDQGASEADRELTRKLRAAIVDNDQLSADAKNIKIITRNGKVTLRGPVASEQERMTIGTILEKAGATSVENQLEVKDSKE